MDPLTQEQDLRRECLLAAARMHRFSSFEMLTSRMIESQRRLVLDTADIFVNYVKEGNV